MCLQCLGTDLEEASLKNTEQTVWLVDKGMLLLRKNKRPYANVCSLPRIQPTLDDGILSMCGFPLFLFLVGLLVFKAQAW